jgi:hypothetical protein
VAAGIHVPRDTAVVNSNEWTAVDIPIVNRHGAVIIPQHVVYKSMTPGILAVSTNGAVNCKEDGIGVITVLADTAQAQVPVHCRLVHYFGPPLIVGLVAGGPPTALSVAAYDADSALIPAVRLRLTIEDSTIIALRDGMVYGLRPGGTGVRVQSLGHVGGEVFFVAAPGDTRSAAESSKPRMLVRPKHSIAPTDR